MAAALLFLLASIVGTIVYPLWTRRWQPLAEELEKK
jgi:hypothetical protein